MYVFLHMNDEIIQHIFEVAIILYLEGIGIYTYITISLAFHIKLKKMSFLPSVIPWLHTCMQHTHPYIHMQIHPYIRKYTLANTYVNTYITYVNTYITYITLHILHTYMHTCMHTYIHTCMHAYIHACTHARTHACTHPHTHICMPEDEHTWSHMLTHTCKFIKECLKHTPFFHNISHNTIQMIIHTLTDNMKW